MSEPERGPSVSNTEPSQRRAPVEEKVSTGPNLFLLYSLIVLALIAASGFALMIVLPFYHRK